MYGMHIGKLHSFKDLGLVPTSKPHVNLPSPKFNYLEVPGRAGSFDLTESLAGEVLYEMREGSFEFLVADKDKWQKAYSRLKSHVHGQKLTLILDTDSAFYYQGRMWVSDFKSDKNYSTITLDYKFEPYKYSVGDINTGGVHLLKGISTNFGQEFILSFDSDMTLVPEFNNTGDNKLLVEFEGQRYAVKQGIHRFPEIRGRKDLTLTFFGETVLDISYKRGWL